MIIQNLSLRVLERAALVDVTNWLVPRALLAVKDQALALRLQNFLRRLPLQLFRWQSSHGSSAMTSRLFFPQMACGDKSRPRRAAGMLASVSTSR